MKKVRITKKTLHDQVWYQIEQRHFIFFWWWVPAWINSSAGASALRDSFDTLEQAEANLIFFDGSEVQEEVITHSKENEALAFGEWIIRNGYEPITNYGWTEDDARTFKTTQELFNLFKTK